jgi:hypothetical protein
MRLAELRGQPPSPEARGEVAGFLNGKSNLLAAKAARIAGEWQATECIPELLSAFDRFLVKPEIADKGCGAKTEILKALCKLEHSSPAIFLRGIRYVQMEAEWRLWRRFCRCCSMPSEARASAPCARLRPAAFPATRSCCA